MQQQENGVDGEPTIILQENCLQSIANNNNNNNNQGQEMKRTKQSNIIVIRCYFQ